MTRSLASIPIVVQLAWALAGAQEVVHGDVADGGAGPALGRAGAGGDGWRAGLVEAGITLGIFVVASALINKANARKVGRPKKVKDVEEAPTPKTALRPCPLKVTAAKEAPACCEKAGGGEVARNRCADATAIVAAVRAGRVAELPDLLDAACERAARRSAAPAAVEEACAQLLLSSLRACATEKRYREGLSAYDHVSTRVGGACREVWSILLYTSVEAHAFGRCEGFFLRLLACGPPGPSGHDLLNMVRCHAHRADVRGMKRMMTEMTEHSFAFDGFTRNRCLATCVERGAVDLAEALLAHPAGRQDLDAVAFNTVMKGHSRSGRLPRCLELWAEMQALGLGASVVTYGILLDACVRCHDFASARGVFEDMQKCGLCFNAVHCTTLIKGLVGVGLLDEAVGVLDEMLARAGAEPDLVTYSTLLRAYSAKGDARSALRLVKKMKENKVEPDELAFNCVLESCSNVTHPAAEVLGLFEQLRRLGLRPSTATLSIVLKALARTHAFQDSLALLASSRRRFGPEATRPRLYGQLAQACVRAGKGPEALEAFDAMVVACGRLGAGAEEAATTDRLLRTCISQGGFELGARLQGAAEGAGVPVSAWVAKTLKEKAALPA